VTVGDVGAVVISSSEEALRWLILLLTELAMLTRKQVIQIKVRFMHVSQTCQHVDNRENKKPRKFTGIKYSNEQERQTSAGCPTGAATLLARMREAAACACLEFPLPNPLGSMEL
jgi:hypothetical protein